MKHQNYLCNMAKRWVKNTIQVFLLYASPQNYALPHPWALTYKGTDQISLEVEKMYHLIDAVL